MRFWGLSTCDTTRKAVKALQGAGRAVVPVDVRDSGLSAEVIAEMLAALGDKAVNRASTTWRNLSDAEKALPPAELLALHPVVMKRPVIEEGGVWTAGWDKTTQAVWLTAG